MPIDRRLLLQLLGAGALSAFFPRPSQAAAGSRAPNLLFVLTDQQRVETMAAYGNHQIKTPNLNALCERSHVFQSFYVSQPICAPSRASALTGLYPHTHGTWENNVPLSPDVATLPELLGDEYVTAYFGKWHLGNEIFRQRGFAEFESTEDNYMGYYTDDKPEEARSGYHDWLVEHGVAPDLPTGHSRGLANDLPKELSKPAYVSKKGVEFLDKHADRPFALFLSFLEPHAFLDHETPPPVHNVNQELYDPDEMPIPETFFEDMDPSVSYQKRVERVALQRGGEASATYPRTLEELKHATARYWGLVTLVDEMLGRVLRRLAELGVEEETIVVFTSDHGEMLGDHRLVGKGTMYENSIKVPLILRVPGTRGGEVTTPVGQVDLVPTLLELMRRPVPESLQGVSWADRLARGAPEPERDVFIENNLEGYARSIRHIAYVRTVITPDGWKLSLTEVGNGELYCLPKDSHERRNLFHSPKHQQIVARLSDKIRDWQRQTKDVVTLGLNQPWPEKR